MLNGRYLKIFVRQCLVLLMCCMPLSVVYADNTQLNDPHEDFNRNMYDFNQGLDAYIARPLVSIYQFIFPDIIEAGVTNFFKHLKLPRTLFNDLLQGEVQQAVRDLDVFAMNTLLGFGGIVDIAHHADIHYDDEDFDQTLAVWGVPRGEYLVIPFLGPSSYRALPSELVDAALNPISYVNWPFQLLGIVDARSNVSVALTSIDENALDAYIFTRSAYLQWRQFHINEGEVQMDELLLEDEEDDLELLEPLDVKL